MKILSSEKADTEGVGTIILISITIIGIGLITLVGIPSIFKMQEMANLKNTEQAFTVLDSHTSRVSLGESRVQKTDVNLGGGSISVVPNSSEKSYVLVELKNGTSVVKSISLDMGKIVYHLGDRELGYEGGGVWSKYMSGSVMVSPPEVHYNGMTLTLPVVNMSGKSIYGGTGRVSMSTERLNDIKIIYPTRDLTNPISENISQVVITIYSSYYDGWADFFTGITFARVQRNASEKKVTINLETPPVFNNFSYGALASTYIDFSNTAIIHSYNSSKGNYSVSKSGNGSIRANDRINLKNPQVIVNGRALSGGSVVGKGTITKNAYGSPIESTINVPPSRKYPAVERIIPGNSINLVQGKINEYKMNNHDLTSFSGGCLSGSGNTTLNSNSWTSDTCTISSGNYYLTEFTLTDTNKKNLVFDTSSGEINIGVSIPAGDVIWKKANISITGNYPVKIWLDGGVDAGSGSEVVINRNGNPNDTSSRFQMVSSSYRDIKFQQKAEYCGFVYAPRAHIYVENNAKIFGALVGEVFSVDNCEEIYFDEALQNLNMNLGEGITIMYMHITQNDIGVSIN
jgi:hypothetical protein